MIKFVDIRRNPEHFPTIRTLSTLLITLNSDIQIIFNQRTSL